MCYRNCLRSSRPAPEGPGSPSAYDAYKVTSSSPHSTVPQNGPRSRTVVEDMERGASQHPNASRGPVPNSPYKGKNDRIGSTWSHPCDRQQRLSELGVNRDHNPTGRKSDRSRHGILNTSGGTNMPNSRGGNLPGGGSPDPRRAWDDDSSVNRAAATWKRDGTYGVDLPEDAFPQEELRLVECEQCGRRFNPEALEKHSRACRSVFLAKRKVHMNYCRA